MSQSFEMAGSEERNQIANEEEEKQQFVVEDEAANRNSIQEIGNTDNRQNHHEVHPAEGHVDSAHEEHKPMEE